MTQPPRPPIWQGRALKILLVLSGLAVIVLGLLFLVIYLVLANGPVGN